MKEYCEELSLDSLLAGLDYFERVRIEPELLRGPERVTIVHGEKDEIAPIGEAMDIMERLPGAVFTCVKGAGHIPFLKEGFKELF